MKQPQVGQHVLQSLEVESGVNEEALPFCQIVATLDDGQIAYGQLPPDAVRDMALSWIQGAEAATMDAILFRMLRDTMGLSLEEVGGFIATLRKTREATGE